jgi:hypothetical protein
MFLVSQCHFVECMPCNANRHVCINDRLQKYYLLSCYLYIGTHAEHNAIDTSMALLSIIFRYKKTQTGDQLRHLKRVFKKIQEPILRLWSFQPRRQRCFSLERFFKANEHIFVIKAH